MLDDRLEEMRRQCNEFHAECPEFWELFVAFAFEKIQLGYKHYGVAAVIERVRWETSVGGKSPALKFNHNHRAFYARRFEQMYPEHKGFFRKRKQISKGKPARGRDDPTRFELDGGDYEYED